MSGKYVKYMFFILMILSSCNINQNSSSTQSVNIIPKVNSEINDKRVYTLNSDIVFSVENETQKIIISEFVDVIKASFKYDIGINIKADITLESNPDLMSETYNLIINKAGVLIQASSNSGFYYGLQSLRQLFPAEIEKKDGLSSSEISLPYLEISDAPRFEWRGMMLDVSRHFFTVEEVKSLIDVLAMFKINTFHWHLVDDQGWRIEIKKYPKLTQTGAYRVNQEHLHWNSRVENSLDDTANFGGFYTQEEIKEVVEYASSKYIKVVPEIEMPAHVMSAIASYPELSCKGENIMVPSGGVWPITEIYCPGKETTFEFIENVLDEVIELFPSRYIHIGGDEATKTNWKSCAHCQKRISAENLENVEELQSYMITRIAKHLQSRGKIMIGWDEIMEGGLSPDAVVMSWQGEKGGLEAASLKHNVIMSPNTYVYLDYYQADKKSEPLAIGGFLPLNHVYKFNPIPAEMPEEDHKYVLGGQANVWTEYMPDFNHLQYMIFPRMLAVSEATWSSTGNKNWDDFSERVKIMFKRFDYMNIEYSKSSFKIRSEKQINPSNKQLEVKLFNEYNETEIRYTTNGEIPTIKSQKYTEPIVVTGNVKINAQVFDNSLAVGEVFSDTITVHNNKAKGALVSYENKYTEKYSAGNNFGLVDGLKGSIEFDDRLWQGWFDEDVVFTIDLQSEMNISGFEISLLVDRGNQILMSENVKIFNSSDGANFSLLKEFNIQPSNNKEKRIEILKSENLNLTTRYLKVMIQNSTNVKSGEKGWLFIDEFIVL